MEATEPLKLLCPPCKSECLDGEDCILCDNCHNWFHFECTKLSKRAFNQFCQNENSLFICYICQNRTKRNCNICKERHTSQTNTLYCVGCLNSFCTSCLPLTDLQIYAFLNTEKPYFCNECSIDHYCSVCSAICNDGCIMCDSCCTWIHYKCSKLTKKQIRRFQRKQSDVYFCRYCVAQNLPLCSVSSDKLNSIFSSDSISTISNESAEESTPMLAFGAVNTENSCNLCIECNTECAYCIEKFCPDLQRVCEMCLHCDYTQLGDLCKSIENFDSVTKKDSLSFLHFNIRSLALHFDSFENTIMRFNPELDIIGLSETRLSRDFNLKKVKIEGYHELETTPSKLACGGTGIYISNRIMFERRSDLEFHIDSCEATIVVIISPQRQKNTIVAVIYRHPHQNYESFFTKLSSFVQKVSSTYNVIILGDINIDTSIPSNNTFSKPYKDILLGLGLRNLINKPTRITNSTETILDHILTNLNYESCESGVLINDITDHLPVYAFCDISVNKLKYSDGQKYRRIFKDSRKDEFLSNFKDMSRTLKHEIDEFDFDPDLFSVRLVKS